MAEKLPVLKAKEVLRALLRAGFYVHHQTGSHARILHETNSELRVTVPMHARDIPPVLLKRILKQASLSEDDFRKYL
ncbi:MAG TPA: type II toxin-antitoxin system HicA family toxin [Candidatus Acidoferrum sp.]|nr:type II toxin-antitoxin system HicA family toxin [Candidatus Acidoferrum sp.]